jgi:hypothetical protein
MNKNKFRQFSKKKPAGLNSWVGVPVTPSGFHIRGVEVKKVQALIPLLSNLGKHPS